MKCAFLNLGKDYGGAENYIKTVVNKWIEAGNKCLLIVRRGSKFHEDLMHSKLKSITIGVSFSLSDIKRTKNLLREEKYDFIHVNGINSGVFSLLIGMKAIPRITTVHSDCRMDRVGKNKFVVSLFEEIENICLNKSKYIIAVSNAIKKLLVGRKISESKILVIPNGIKEKFYSPKMMRTSSETLKICYVGRLEIVKGCDVLIKALARLREIDYQCDIWGDGTQRNQLELLCKELSICDMVHFKGYSSNVREFLNQYDLLIQPSRYEAFGLSLIEAMNAKTEIVCSNVGGMQEIIEDGKTGFTFDVGEYEKLSQIIEYIYNSPEKQGMIIEKSYSKFKKHYTEDVMVNKTFELFGKVCELK